MAAVGVEVPQALGDLFAEILQLKNAGTEDMQSRLNAGAVKILQLKSIHRGMCEATEALREDTSNAKVQLDQSSLQLQSLLYEKHHYEREIQACTSFRSDFPDEQLELLSLADYITQHAAAAREAPAAAEASTDPHQMMLARLQHELKFRQETVKELEVLKARRDGLAAEVAQKWSALAGIDSEVGRLRTAAQRVQKQYSVDYVGIGEAERLVALLPAPLYLLYTHLKAVSAVEQLPLHLSITGEQAAALRKQMHQALVRSPSAPANVVEAALAKAAEAAYASGGSSSSRGSPLSVSVAVHQPSTKPLLVATFHYILVLNAITVSGENKNQDAKLSTLFGDGGDEESPLAGALDADTANALPGKAYAWAQRVCGLDVLPPLDQLVARGGGSGGVAAALSAVQRYQNERRAHALAQKLVQAAGL